MFIPHSSCSSFTLLVLPSLPVHPSLLRSSSLLSLRPVFSSSLVIIHLFFSSGCEERRIHSPVVLNDSPLSSSLFDILIDSSPLSVPLIMALCNMCDEVYRGAVWGCVVMVVLCVGVVVDVVGGEADNVGPVAWPAQPVTTTIYQLFRLFRVQMTPFAS